MPKSDLPKTNGTRIAKGFRRWNHIENKVMKKWHKVFNDKFRNFEDVWSLTVSMECPCPDEWENSLEERLSMACKCKDCGHVWVTDTGIACFFYSIVKSVNDGNEGKVLVWVKPEFCPNKKSCGSSKMMPLMDVYQDEVEAVITYLMMEIGWFFYECQYTENDEASVESRRLLRVRKLKSGAKNKTVANKKSTKSEIAIREGKIASKDQSPPAIPSGQGKLGNPKPNVPQANQIIDIKRYTKMENRWNLTPAQIKAQWELSFHSKFDHFTNKNPKDKWIMSLEKVTKNHPLRREKRWDRFLGEQVEAGFKCEKCKYVWESKRAWISFWIWQNPRNNEGIRIGEVAVHILGQKCLKCPGNPNDKGYYTGDLQSDEIDVVLDFLFMEIDFKFYNNDTYTHWDEEAVGERRTKAPKVYFGRAEHRKELCQPCQQKVCKKTVCAAYPGPVVPPPGDVQ